MFYLHVPDVNMSIVDVEDSALARLEHFATYGKISDNTKYVQYLKNSTLLDYAGFLCLRTHASLTNDNMLKELILEGECSLITERFNLLKPNFLRKYLIKIIDDIGHCGITDDNIEVLLKVCAEYKNKQHVPCSEGCNEQSIKVPWQKCLSSVSTRKVQLIEGTAIVPCYLWNSLLVDLFRLIYTKSLLSIRRSKSALAKKSLKFEYLSDQINMFYNSNVAFWRNTNEQMTIGELDLKQKLLPPCMLLSLKSLYTNHRLGHDPRYRLTLFLKNIGVPIDQTLGLFKEEYSKCSNSESSCTHTWDEHHKKIVYNVRHTYGMLGSKKNYQMTSCALMQKQICQITDEGCCPFVHFSKNKLKSILEEFTHINDDEMNHLNDLRNSDQPIRACHWYINKLFQMSKPMYHSTPTQYFFNSKKVSN